MTIHVEIAGRRQAVTVEPVADEPHRFRVALGARSVLVDARRLGSGLSLIIVDDGHASHEVRVIPGDGPGLVTVLVDGVGVPAIVSARRTDRRMDRVAAGAGAERVTAPMPGRVVRVLVTVGQDVDPGDALVVVEAMKMENELRSMRAGRVREIAVEAGASVEAGRVLLVVE
jgi:acetyl/propionyl-CoA carboxylase alpha subunit